MLMPANALSLLRELGQSPWCDQLSRDMIDSGELKRLIEVDGITGLTSNPTIFQKALAQGSRYDLQIRHSARRGHNVKEIYEEVATSDVQAVADALRPVFESSEGVDGYVSLEVSPDLAYDADASVVEARRLHAAVSRQNLMIKIPATQEGLSAITALLGQGISVNATLVFGLQRYRELLEAHARGLTAAHKNGLELRKIASVASFFVSRVDTLVDQQLQAKLTGPNEATQRESLTRLLGTAAIANARAAYIVWRKFIEGETMLSLSALGARPQRLLWASTSTKNPNYGDVRYVEELIGRHTVNTMPLETVKAFIDHGRVRGEPLVRNPDETKAQLAALAGAGIDMEGVAAQLESDGVKLFADSFAQLLSELARKLSASKVAKSTEPTPAASRRAAAAVSNGVLTDGSAAVPIFVGIGGDSGTGKSTLTSAFFALFGDGRIAGVCLDDYHSLDRRQRGLVGLTALNPRANNFALMEEQIWSLKRGNPIDKPIYNHHNGTLEGPERLQPREVVIMQGLHPFLVPGIRHAFDLKVWLDPEAGLRERWKVQRDVAKRGYTREQVVAELEARRPDAELYIKPQRRHADLVVQFYRAQPDSQDMGHLNVRIIQRHTLTRLNFDRQLLRARAVRLSLDVDDADGQRSDVIEIDGNIEPAEATMVEDNIWAHIDGRHGTLHYVGPAMLGNYEAARSRRHSDPLALTQLILAHRILSAQKSIILRATSTNVAAAT
ncbi:MAG: transaldolase [Candidatus Eremiobacter antarcticus]|nr:transaldolase [Candidatus Eremiobacteraeota bacterium]PZR62428.1 MAG: transaldolase [Candidatus Eremiobacter sp. RRmetagenome_bin22]